MLRVTDSNGAFEFGPLSFEGPTGKEAMFTCICTLHSSGNTHPRTGSLLCFALGPKFT